MTILGKHTIDETEHLMKTVEFRLQAIDKTNSNINPAFMKAFPDMYADLQHDWANWKNRWKICRENVLPKLIAFNVTNPLVPASMIACEDEYQTVKKAINVGGGETYVKGDMFDCSLRVEAAAGTRIDDKDAPMPSGFDPDISLYKKLDSGIRAGEQAAKDAADAAGKAAKSNVGLLVLGGVGLLAGTVILTKVYL